MVNKQVETSKTALLNAVVAMGMFTLAVVFPEMAFAQQVPTPNTPSGGVQNLVNDVTGNLSGVLPAFSAAAYVGGTVFGISTLLDAKKYSENPSGFQGGVPKIVTKGAVAAGLFSLPSLIGTVKDSFFNGTPQANYEVLRQGLGG